MSEEDKLKVERRAQILLAAENCFSQKGYHQTSMQDICSEAGMSIGNLYRYFESKEEIIKASAESELGWLQSAINELNSTEDLIQALLDTFFWSAGTCMSNGRSELAAELFAEAGRNGEVRAIYERFTRHLKEAICALLRSAQNQGVIDDRFSRHDIADIFISLANGLIVHRIVNPDIDILKIRPTLEHMLRSVLVKSQQAA